MNKKLIIFGAGKIAQAVTYHFARDSHYEIVAYCCDKEFIKEPRFLKKPLIAKEEALKNMPPDTHEMFVALGYQGMNSLRMKNYLWAKDQGYSLARYRSPGVPGNYHLGENSIVMDGAVMQPCVSIGNNSFIWGGAMIGHHTVIEDHCWITESCAIGGTALIGEATFIGLNATLGHEVQVGKKCMIGANTLANKSLPDGTVLMVRDTEPHRLNADQFSRMSTCFRV